MRANLPGAASRLARQALVKLVVVAGAVDPDLLGGLEPRRAVEAAGREADCVAAGHLPEQRRAALGTEPAPCVPDAVRAVDPAKPAVLAEVEVRPSRLAGRPDVTGPSPALR